MPFGSGARAETDADRGLWAFAFGIGFLGQLVQFNVTPRSVMKLELREKSLMRGDIEMRFDPNNFLPGDRRDSETDSARFGCCFSSAARTRLLLSYLRTHDVIKDFVPATAEIDPVTTSRVGADIRTAGYGDSFKTQVIAKENKYRGYGSKNTTLRHLPSLKGESAMQATRPIQNIRRLFVAATGCLSIFAVVCQADSVKTEVPRAEAASHGSALTITVPQNSRPRMIVVLDERGQAISVSGVIDGRVDAEIGQCVLCSADVTNHEYATNHEKDPTCKRLSKEGVYNKEVKRNLPICGALTGGTVNEIVPVVIMRAHLNPDCLIWKEAAGVVVYTYPKGCAHP